MGHNQRFPFTTHASFSSESPPRASWQQLTTLEAVSKRQKMPVLFAFGVHASGIQSPQVLVGSRMRGRRTSGSGRGRGSIGHGSNIVTPPEETGGQQGKRTVSKIQETPADSRGAAIRSWKMEGVIVAAPVIRVVTIKRRNLGLDWKRGARSWDGRQRGTMASNGRYDGLRRSARLQGVLSPPGARIPTHGKWGGFCWILVDPCPSVAENGYGTARCGATFAECGIGAPRMDAGKSYQSVAREPGFPVKSNGRSTVPGP